MRNYILTYSILLLSSIITFSACTSDKKQDNEEGEEKVPTLLSKNDDKNNDIFKSSKKTSNEDKISEKEFKDEEANNKLMSPQMRLLSKLDKNAKIEFVDPDYAIIQNDTLIKSDENIFEISYTTACLNDSLIAQEMYDFGRTNKKNYLISHNYKTNVAVKVNGKVTGTREIKKELFLNQVDKDFLEKSIIKHPEFVRFDENKKEAVFEFMVGVPNTDWLVIAGINMQQDGKLRIIEIIAPGM